MGAINIPGYKIVKTLGVGGQATVYLAIQESFEREVALKVMSPALAADPTFGERFLREAKIVAKLRHPGIVTVHDVGEHDGFYYLAMEYLPNTDLRSRITSGIKVKDALSVIVKVAEALDYAHKKGYIHRDVKSENILFREDGLPVLTDFGIAKASNSSTQMTQQGKLIGTPQYMSPEQCRGKPLDGRSDIYSLGIIFYEMLNQSVPFDGEDSVAVCLQHVTKPIPRLSVRHKHLQWLLDRLMAKKPDDRFATAGALAAEVNQFLAGDITSVSKTTQATLVATREEKIADIFKEDDALVAEERFYTQETEKKSRWPWVLGLFVVVGVVGYTQRALWLPQAEQLWADVSGQPQTQPVSNQTESNKPDTASNQTVTPVSNIPTNNDNALGEAEQQAKQKQIAELLVEAQSLEPLPNLDPSQMRTLLQNYIRVIALDPTNSKAISGKMSTLNRAATSAQAALEQNNETQFQQYRQIISSTEPELPVLNELEQQYQDFLADSERRKLLAESQSQISEWLALAKQAMANNQLTTPENESALYFYQQVLSVDSANAEAIQGIESIKERYVKVVQKALLDKDLNKARGALTRLKNIDNADERLTDLNQQYQVIKAQVEEERRVAAEEEKVRQKELARQQMLADPLTQLKIKSKLDSARLAYTENRLILPATDNALAKYREVLTIDSSNQQALDGINLIKEKLVSLIKDAIQNGEKATAEEWLTQLKSSFSSHESIPVLQQQIVEMDLQMDAEPLDSASGETALPTNASIDSLPEALGQQPIAVGTESVSSPTSGSNTNVQESTEKLTDSQIDAAVNKMTDSVDEAKALVKSAKDQKENKTTKKKDDTDT